MSKRRSVRVSIDPVEARFLLVRKKEHIWPKLYKRYKNRKREFNKVYDELKCYLESGFLEVDLFENKELLNDIVNELVANTVMLDTHGWAYHCRQINYKLDLLGLKVSEIKII